MIDQDNNEDGEQPQPQGSIHYYEFFDEMTNNGKVFDEDLSDQVITTKSLTPGAQETREAYKKTIESLQEYYENCDDKNHPIATTKEEVLQQRVVAPCLQPGSVSGRSATNERRSCRMYPTNIHPWTDFQEEVENYKVDGNATKKMKRIFFSSLDRATTESSNEADEQHRLLDNLDKTLKKAGIVHSIVQKDKALDGLPDFSIKTEDNKTSIICECKSTHNLLLPMTAEKCTTAYNTAYAKTNQFKKTWSNVAHPIGQLLAYLIDNGHCYGALTSGTRTYFLKIEVPSHINSYDSLDGAMQANAVDHKASPNSTKKKIKKGEAAGTLRLVPAPTKLDGEKKANALDHKASPNSKKKKMKKGEAAGTSRLVPASTKLDGEKKASALDHKASPNSTQKKMENPPKKRTNKKMKVGETAGTPVSSNKGNFQSIDCDDGIKVYISDAWFVGQANYLRAWAYVHNLRQTMQPFTMSPSWLRSTTDMGTPEERGAKPSRNDNLKDDSSFGNNNFKDDSSSPDDGRPPSENRSGGEFGNTCNIEYYYPIHHGAIAFAQYNDIVKVGVLGEGRNGGCFKVKWKGTEYAMKQFDIGKHGDKHFVKEIRAYMLLKDVWGILVPRPIFLSESYSGNIMFLGLQLGRESDNDDDDDYKKFQNVLQRINKEYGIRHNDAECGRNMITITGSDGKERVVAIDFEDWDEVLVQLPVD